ncbi:MAG: hypothetical protein RL358_1899 [Pseudomonadota bacterium]|jgi:transcriptional regulator with XRE-family HTH domain
MDLIAMEDDEICSYLASLIRAARLERKYSQEVMAKKAGIPLRTYKRIESTGAGSIQNLIVILRALDRLVGIQLLLPTTLQPNRLSITERLKIVAANQQINRR